MIKDKSTAGIIDEIDALSWSDFFDVCYNLKRSNCQEWSDDANDFAAKCSWLLPVIQGLTTRSHYRFGVRVDPNLRDKIQILSNILLAHSNKE